MEKTSSTYAGYREKLVPLLSIRGLSKKFDKLTVIEDFSLDLPAGSFTAIVGPSGCGKSTFFDLLTGSVTPDNGKIIWNGDPVSNLSEKAAWMGQKDFLLPWLNLRGNALLPRKAGGKTSKKDDSDVDQLLLKLGLNGFEEYLPHQVSGGMRQRCALARTLLFDRELILLDEPLSALDAITRQGLQDLLVALQYEFDRTILMITHDVEEALLTADRVLVLSSAPMVPLEDYPLESVRSRHRDDPDIVKLRSHILDRLKAGERP